MPTPYALTIAVCEREAIHEVGGGALAGPAEIRELVDRAGHALVGMAAWRWLEGRQARLRARAPIELEGATWTEATKTLTLTGAFANYTWLEADVGEDVSGTGANAGTYEIASRVSDNAITLATSIGAAADGQTDIAMTLPNDQVELPSDFDIQRVTAWGVIGWPDSLSLSTGQTLLDLRWSRGHWACSFWGLLNHVRSSADGRTIPRLDLSPGTRANEELLVVFYRAGWATPEDDADPLPLPKSGWLNALFVELLKCFVHAQEDDQSLGTLAERLAAVKASTLFSEALARDQTLSPQLGSVGSGGWMDPYRSGRCSWWDRGTVLGTSV